MSKMSLDSMKALLEPCLSSATCQRLADIARGLCYFMAAVITIADLGSDVLNTIQFSNPCILTFLPMFDNERDICKPCNTSTLANVTAELSHSNLLNPENPSQFKLVNPENSSQSTLVDPSQHNCSRVALLDPVDPIWMRWSIFFFFAPGLIMATYLILSISTWYSSDDRSSNVEMFTIIAVGLSGLYGPMLLIMQLMFAFNYKKAQKNEFITDFLPLMMGIEAFGESAPQVVLNVFAISTKYPLRRFQLIALACSLLGTSVRVLEYDMIAEKDDNTQKMKWWKKGLRLLCLFFFYLLSTIGRCGSLCLVFLYCRRLAILPAFLNALFIFLFIKIKYKGDWASSFLFSVNNFYICSNGGPDNIKETSFHLMSTTSIICLTNLTAWQFGSMYYTFKLSQGGNDHLEWKHHYDGTKIDFGEFGVGDPGWVCGWILVLNLLHLLMLRILHDVEWLPQTEYDITMKKTTSSRREQMRDQNIEQKRASQA